MTEFEGKVAFITGGGRGIGEAICTRLAQGGAHVVVTDRDQASAERLAGMLSQQGLKASGFALDVASADDVRGIVDRIETEIGPIHILVNNAGVSEFKPFLDMSEEAWDRVIRVNLKGTFLTCQAVIPHMVARKAGRIVNMGSAFSKQGGVNFAHYSASKFAVLGFTQSIGAEFAPHGITANCVCPGIVATAMWDGPGGTISSAFSSPDEADAFVRRQIPTGRTQPPEDIAEMVAFLASEKARNMTAGSYHVDGGMIPR